jgi:heme a synthase
MNEPRYIPALHRLAIATAVATFPLIFMGGLVTSKQAGMAVPDWPNSYGYNMFLFPPSLWLGQQAGGIFYEHAHRLMGTVVGFCSILLVLWAWGPGRNPTARRWLGRIAVTCAAATSVMAAVLISTRPGGETPTSFWTWKSHLAVLFASVFLVSGAAWMARTYEPRRWVRWLAVAVLVAVILQGALGGMRVVLVKLNLAVVHACFAQAFFCLAALAAVVTSRWWHVAGENASSGTGVPPVQATHHQQSSSGGSTGQTLVRLAVISVALVFAQLIAGALMRHHDAGLAIPDLPLAYGNLLPPVTADQLDAANQSRIWQMQLPAVTLTQVWMHFAHRVGAVIVSIALAALIWIVLRRHRHQPALTRPAWLLAALLIVQLSLGVLTILMRKPADIATAHVAVGALLLVTLFILTVRAMRLYSPQLWAQRGFDVAPSLRRPVPV